MSETTQQPIYYITRWQDTKTGAWHISTMEGKPTLAEAQEQLKKDVAYFYDYINIQLVRIEENVVSEHKGSRPTNVKKD